MTIYNDQISEYITSMFARPDPMQNHIYEVTPQKGLPAISIKPEEGRFLQFLVRLSGGQKALEIGTLGGYSGIWIARGLAPGGRLITVEVDPRHAEVAREHFQAAGVADRIEIRLGNAHDHLPALAAEGPFDFIFIDAEKTGYPAYLTWATENVRVGGAIAMHNAFRKGSVVGQGQDDDYSEVMRQFNLSVANETRLLSTIYPAGDGTLISVRIE